MQKRSEKSLIFKGFWDTAISNHIRVNETIDECINRTASENLYLNDLKPLFLLHYTCEIEQEYHYAFFYICRISQDITQYNHECIDCAKWWTISQIEDNLDKGIFSKNFILEYKFAQRAGVIG
jgi:ADP-ribose pyrophosphatase YjhB (NUDIX family)